MKILMPAQYETKGRYKGGIIAIVNAVIKQKEYLKCKGIEIIPFETNRVNRKRTTNGIVDFKNFRNAASIISNLIKEAKRVSPDVVYFHTSAKLAFVRDIIALSLIKRKTGVRTVLHIHYAEYDKILPQNVRLRAWIIRRMNRYVDRVAFLSSRTADEFMAHGLNPEKPEIIYTFHEVHIEEKRILNKTQRMARREPLQLVFLGSVDKRKGITDLLAALEMTKKSYKLRICGTYTDESIRKQVESYLTKQADYIEYCGYVSGDEKLNILYDSDILFLPSYGEGLAVVLMEAMAAGCAVVTTDVGANPEILSEKNGYVLKPGDVGGLLNAFEALDADRARLGKISLYNFNKSKKYTVEKFIDGVIKACA